MGKGNDGKGKGYQGNNFNPNHHYFWADDWSNYNFPPKGKGKDQGKHQSWDGANGKGGKGGGFDASLGGRRGKHRAYLTCSCGNTVPEDRKFVTCTRCNCPWVYPKDSKHDPNAAPVASPTPADPKQIQADSKKLATDPKVKDFFAALAKIPALADAASAFQGLLTTVAKPL